MTKSTTTTKRVAVTAAAAVTGAAKAPTLTGAVNLAAGAADGDVKVDAVKDGSSEPTTETLIESTKVPLAELFENCALAQFLVPRLEVVLATAMSESSTVEDCAKAGAQFTAILNVLGAAKPLDFEVSVSALMEEFKQTPEWYLPRLNRVAGTTQGSAVFFHGLLRLAKDSQAPINYRAMSAVFEAQQERIADQLAAMFAEPQ